MSKSGVAVNPECVTAFNDLKLRKDATYIIYRLSDDYKEIVVEEKSQDKDWDNFREKLLAAKSGYKGKEQIGPRYAVYDFTYKLKDGEGERSKLTFIAWSPDNALVFPKMTYASSKEALKNSLSGLADEVQANDQNDLEYSSIIEHVSKGKSA